VTDPYSFELGIIIYTKSGFKILTVVQTVNRIVQRIRNPKRRKVIASSVIDETDTVLELKITLMRCVLT
jgi:hypothetical protein